MQNKLQKNHKKSLKRNAKRAKHVKYHSSKTGRAKVQVRQQKEHRRLLLAEMLKEKPKSTSDFIAESSETSVEYSF